MNPISEQYLDWLIGGLKRLHATLHRFWNRQASPAEASQRETYTDQW